MLTNPNSDWFYSRADSQTGPFSLAALRKLVAGGQLGANELVWTEGLPAWTAVADISLLHSAIPRSFSHEPAPSDPLEQLAAARGDGDFEPQHHTHLHTLVYSSRRSNGPSQQGMAIAGFITSLLFPVVGLILSAVALHGMKRHNNDEGKGLATAGLIIGVVYVGLVFLSFLIFGVILVER